MQPITPRMIAHKHQLHILSHLAFKQETPQAPLAPRSSQKLSRDHESEISQLEALRSAHPKDQCISSYQVTSSMPLPSACTVARLVPHFQAQSQNRLELWLKRWGAERSHGSSPLALHWLSIGSIQSPGAERVAVQCASPAFQPPHGRCNSV